MSVQTVATGAVNISVGSGFLDNASRAQIQSLLGLNVLDNESTIVGQDAAPFNAGRFNTIIGREAGRFSELGVDNVFVGYRAGESSEGANNMLIGNNAGAMNGANTDNMFIGNGTGEAVFSVATNRNTVLGHFSGAELSGIDNTLIGYSNTTVEQAADLGVYTNNNTGAVGVGANTFCSMDRGVSVGFGCSMLADFVVAAGASNTITSTGGRSVVLGSHIRNSGRRAVIVRSCDMEQAADGLVPVLYTNTMDGFLNIHDRLVGRSVVREADDGGDEVVYQAMLRGEEVVLVSSPNTSTADMSFEDGGDARSLVRVHADGVDLGARALVHIRAPETLVDGNLAISGEVRMSGDFDGELSGGFTQTGAVNILQIDFVDQTGEARWQQLLLSGAESAAGGHDLRFVATGSRAFLDLVDEDRRPVHAV